MILDVPRRPTLVFSGPGQAFLVFGLPGGPHACIWSLLAAFFVVF